MRNSITSDYFLLIIINSILPCLTEYANDGQLHTMHTMHVRFRHQRSRTAFARQRVRSPWSEAAATTPRPDGSERNDIVTKFLRLVEMQHVLGENCTAGTDLMLTDGVVANYAQDKFRLEASVAVNRANFLTRLWTYAPEAIRKLEYIFYAGVRSMIDFDEDIFGAGNCYDDGAFKEGLFCPFAYRHPDGTVIAKDLAVEYKYLSNTSEWFFRARTSAHRLIDNLPTALHKGFNLLRHDVYPSTLPEQEEIILVSYEDGWWTKPYFDCGGGNIWMMTYTVPFFGYDNGSYVFKGTSGIDIDLRRVDINQCSQGSDSHGLNVFAASDKCKRRTTWCQPIPGLGFRRGSYKCVCRDGFYFPGKVEGFFSGSKLEEEFEKLIHNEENLYDDVLSFECLRCADGCDVCIDDRPCYVSLNWALRSTILALNSLVMSTLPLVALFTYKYAEVKVVKAASPLLLRVIIIGAALLYGTIVVMYFSPTMAICTVRMWLREIGFALSYGALLLKTWRISVIFHVRSAKAIKITDMDLVKGLGFVVGFFTFILVIRTMVDTPHVIIGRTRDDLKALLCSTNWWDHTFTLVEMLFLVWGIRLCVMVRKAPTEFNESKFISLAIYNEFLLSIFLNVSMLFLQSPANPDLLYIIFFCHSQLTTTLLLGLIFGSKVYLAFKCKNKEEESGSATFITKPLTAKFFAHPKSVSSQLAPSSSTSIGQGPVDAAITQATEENIQDEVEQVFAQLETIKAKCENLGYHHLVLKLSAIENAFSSHKSELEEQKTFSDISFTDTPKVAAV